MSYATYTEIADGSAATPGLWNARFNEIASSIGSDSGLSIASPLTIAGSHQIQGTGGGTLSITSSNIVQIRDFNGASTFGSSIIQAGAVESGGVQSLLANSSGNVRLGVQGMDTDATSGFATIPTTAGNPTGTPAFGAGSIVFDSTNNRLNVWNGSSWVSTQMS